MAMALGCFGDDPKKAQANYNKLETRSVMKHTLVARFLQLTERNLTWWYHAAITPEMKAVIESARRTRKKAA